MGSNPFVATNLRYQYGSRVYAIVSARILVFHRISFLYQIPQGDLWYGIITRRVWLAGFATGVCKHICQHHLVGVYPFLIDKLSYTNKGLLHSEDKYCLVYQLQIIS